ncbi:chemotaxis protein CheW [Anaeromyxobacter paludicola]|uniref:CheW-like domain-containing protein n=1 Tax=Anaeromyxobacter paludicola TaxID=2918171 RepID=A0ABN6N141_9BACT|nr:chemotaxis protein CheW [Anaeromyxobacter paludicola]BDG06934.1 hypothetical protein AMPC_00470 [Anaeromyxobacter paludicola]
MDFLKIRKKAQERSEARASATRPPPAPAISEERPPSAAPSMMPLEDPPAPAPREVPSRMPEDRAPPAPAELLSAALTSALAPVFPPVSMMPLEEPSPAPKGAPAPLWSPALIPADAPPERADRAAPPPAAPRAAPEPPPEPTPELPPRQPADALSEFFFAQDEVGPAVPDLGLCDPGAQSAGEAPEARREYLAFRLGGEEYAFAIDFIREILKAPPITEVPRAPAHVLGVITVRGDVIPVFDPRRRLGLAPAPAEGRGQGRVIICDAGEGPCGLLVDAVAQVVRLPPSAIEQKPQGIVGSSAEYIAGIGRERDRLYILLDLAAVLRFSKPKEALAP